MRDFSFYSRMNLSQGITVALGAVTVALVVLLVLFAQAHESPSSIPFVPFPSLSPVSTPVRQPTRRITPSCMRAGCSQELCVDARRADIISTNCVYKEEYRCLIHSRCEIQLSGDCGWTMTDGYRSCVSGIHPSIVPVTSGNIALRKPVIAAVGQVNYLDYASRFPPENMTDGNRSNGWRTETDSESDGSRARAIIDLRAQYRLSSIVYVVGWDSKPEYDREILFRISVSGNDIVSLDNADDWTVLSDRYLSMEDNSQPVTISFLPVSARFIKVEYVDDDGQWAGWGNIGEIEAYGL